LSLPYISIAPHYALYLHPLSSLTSLSSIRSSSRHSSPPPRNLHPFPTRRSSDLVVLTRSGSICVSFELREPECYSLTPEDIDRRSEEHTSELHSRFDLVCRLLLEKKNNHEVMNPSRGWCIVRC